MLRKNFAWIIAIILFSAFLISFSAAHDEEEKSKMKIKIFSSPEIESYSYSIADFNEGEEKVFEQNGKEIKVKRIKDKLIVTIIGDKEGEEEKEFELSDEDEITILDKTVIISSDDKSHKRIIITQGEDDSDALILENYIAGTLYLPEIITLSSLHKNLEGIDEELAEKLKNLDEKMKDLHIIVKNEEGSLADLEKHLSKLPKDLEIIIEDSDLEKIFYKCPKGDTTLWVDKEEDKGRYTCPNDGEEMKRSN